jgi:hypothetical protein
MSSETSGVLPGSGGNSSKRWREKFGFHAIVKNGD